MCDAADKILTGSSPAVAGYVLLVVPAVGLLCLLAICVRAALLAFNNLRWTKSQDREEEDSCTARQDSCTARQDSCTARQARPLPALPSVVSPESERRVVGGQSDVSGGDGNNSPYKLSMTGLNVKQMLRCWKQMDLLKEQQQTRSAGWAG